MKVELNYQNKLSKHEILNKAKNYKSIEFNKSAFFYGENFAVLASLLNSGLREGIDLVYIDPPYNTNQDFTVLDDRIRTISRSAKGITAYGDKMPFENYLEFIRERLILIYELLSAKGSLYLHIDDKAGHYIKIILDEIFGSENFKNDICRIKSNPKNFNRSAYGNQKDRILFYVKNKDNNIWNEIKEQKPKEDIEKNFPKIDSSGRRYTTVPVHAPGETVNGETGGIWKGQFPPSGRHWRVSPKELDRLDAMNLIEWSKNAVPRIIKYADEHKGNKIQDIWNLPDPQSPIYPTQKNKTMLERIIKQSSNVNSIVLDCFAGGGTTLAAAQNLNRVFIGIDNSPVSLKTIEKNLSSSNNYKIIKYDETTTKINTKIAI
jgi:adenine-specific DNA-methyltransferase